ncbi:hypothetical protein VNO78_19544 [Psophocarpus tetragonolobus]|uniref:Uncharacterized protein n=1 Tax=Psophocarpus tetragonolobus TaxID=3891 RepID=A0AAN9S8Q7_PSOTE
MIEEERGASKDGSNVVENEVNGVIDFAVVVELDGVARGDVECHSLLDVWPDIVVEAYVMDDEVITRD